jgi:hypothetical protein
MGQTVDANGRSILHKGHGMTHTCAVPDVCKTPSPAGPVPIPYVNIAMDSDLADGAGSVQIEGNPVANVGSKLSTSSGDEAGTVGGLISSKFKGTVTWTMGSLDVKAEGKGVVRFLDNAFHNGNTFNVAFINMGGTGAAYADDSPGPCPICNKGPHEHRILETPSSAELCSKIVETLRSNFEGADDEGRKTYARFNEKKARKKNKKMGDSPWGGYMVGVMICPCGTSFAAMSGPFLDGFNSVAGDIVDEVIPGDAATVSELASANTSSAANDLTKLQTIQTRVDIINGKRQRGLRGYNQPGNCAGAKLVARSHHKPVQMTEMFFLPPHALGQWQGSYRWLETTTPLAVGSEAAQYAERVLQNQWPEDPPEHTFEPGETVGSCHTCQELLFMTMCPERVCSS